MMSEDLNLPEITTTQSDDPNYTGPSPEHITSVIEKYVKLFSAEDAEGIADLYAEDATVKDPATHPGVKGRKDIVDWYNTAFKQTGGDMELLLEGAVRVAGRYGAAAMICHVPNHEPPFNVESVDVMEFNDEGLITSMLAYWGKSSMKMG